MTTSREGSILTALYSTRSSFGTGWSYYHSIAPSTAEIPFVVTECIESIPVYNSEGIVYEKILIRFNVVALTDSSVDTEFPVIDSIIANLSLTGYNKLSVYRKTQEINRTIIKSRNNKPVWMGVLDYEIWVN